MEQEIKKCLEVLRAGGVILYPTDTVWGIGCDASNPEAVEKVYAIKRRSDSKSLVLLASDIDMVAAHVEEIPEMALQLIEVNDKPMTLIYPKAFKPALAPPMNIGRGWQRGFSYSEDGFLSETGSSPASSFGFDFCQSFGGGDAEDLFGDFTGNSFGGGLCGGSAVGDSRAGTCFANHQGGNGWPFQNYSCVNGTIL